jgi:ribosome-associated protein
VTVSSNLSGLRPEIRLAVEAAQEKHASDITVLDLQGAGAFSEYFILCSGQSQPQLRAIGEAIEERLEKHGRRLSHREGKPGAAEWLLLDYGSFIVHIFSERAREYYDLERLWRNAERLDLAEPDPSRATPDESEGHAARG